ncbi:MAG: hypothetical protein A2046_01640 [Bacteroidetes bacterium GWA2_30_7]|nr:MAG: hypothetical protein A2046_01640 [Bacteroidetes bacterium GWA2_30_7]
MITNFYSYKVKIRNNQFVAEDGRVFENTASISFFDENKKELAFKEYGYIDTEDIFKLIDNNEAINLNNCYIENFSLSIYRNSRNIDKDNIVKIKSLSAENSIFESSILNDFSFAKIESENISFKHSHFINGAVDFSNCDFGYKEADFSYCFFNNGNVDFKNSTFGTGEVTFKNSIFKTGIKDFQYVDFGEGEIIFVNTEFGDGDVSFINTNFNSGHVSFKIARFGNGKIDLHFAKFGSGDISFERTEFQNGKVDFRKVEFGSGKINFNRAVFGSGEVSFEGSSLSKGKMSFKKTEFGSGFKGFDLLEFENSDLLFEGIDFGEGNVSFNNSKIHTLSLSSCHLDNYFDFRLSHCSYLDLSDTIVRDIIDFLPYDFDVKIKHINLSGMRLIGRIDIDWFKNSVYDTISTLSHTSLRAKAEQFRILKENFGGIGQYNQEDLAYIEFKRYEQKAELDEALKSNKANALIHYPIYGFKWLMFDKVGLYATSPARVLTSTIITYFIFSVIHTILPYVMETSINCIDPATSFISRFLNTMYYSAITFFTIGYGDCSPVGFLRFVASFQGFFGVFMMSYFTVAFARKILR